MPSTQVCNGARQVTLVGHSIGVGAPLVALGLSFLTSTAALGWGATGHEWVSGIAVEKLPDSLPSFIQSPEAIAEIAVMGRELDRSGWAIREGKETL